MPLPKYLCKEANRMTNKILPILFIATLISFSTSTLFASDDDYDDDYKEHVYGWELMSDEEFSEHRDKMRSLETREERQAYRKEHHEEMMKRAKEKGVELPDCPYSGRYGKS